jgi:hypothetical protein
MAMHKPEQWLETALERELRGATAPAELWDRIQAHRVAVPAKRINPRLVWVMAGAVVLAAVALSLVRAQREGGAGDEAFAIQALRSDSQRVAFHCQNPAQLRAWVRARTGLDLPLRAEASPSIRLIGAQTIDGARGVEVAYRAGSRDGVLVVSRADAGASNLPHSHAGGSVSSWVMAGQRYTLATDNPTDLQLACKLCHLD